MAHILIITGDLVSIRNNVFELVRRLECAEHRVTYASPADIKDVVTAEGISYVQLNHPPQSDEAKTLSENGGTVSRWLRWLRGIQSRRQAAIDSLVADNFAGVMKRLNPDIVLVEIELHAYIMATASLGFSLGLICGFIAPFKRKGIPPLHRNIVPGDGLRGSRLGIEFYWLRYRFYKWRVFQINRLRHLGTDSLSKLQGYADRVDFPRRGEFLLYQWLIPLNFRSIPILNLNAVEFDFPHIPHPLVSHTGPLIRLDRSDSHTRQNGAEQQRLENLLAEHRSESNQRKLVYCAFGTAFKGNDTEFLWRVIQAVARKPDWTIVLALGGRDDVEKLGSLPPNVYVFEWVPQLQVLELADCAVIHAGPGTIYECIHFDVPMLVYPFAVNDQQGYAARVTYHRLGIIGNRTTDSSNNILQHIEQLLTDFSFRVAMQRMRDHFEGYQHAVPDILAGWIAASREASSR